MKTVTITNSDGTTEQDVLFSSIASSYSSDGQTAILLWSDGRLTIGQTVTTEGEYEHEVELEPETVQSLLELLQSQQAQSVIEPAPKQAE